MTYLGLPMLSGLDFMVNFENAGQKQTPSKLIDYAIIDKPILSIKTGALNKALVKEFLNGNYSGGIKIDKERYRIETKHCLNQLGTTGFSS